MRYESIRDSGRNWLTFMGRSGSGKTTQACMIVAALMRRKKPVRAKIYNWAELVRKLAANRFNDVQYEESLESILEPELIVFDDFLDVLLKEESFEEQVAITLIKRRYVQQRPLIITTELTPEDVARAMSRHGEALFGRILEMSDGRLDVASGTAINYRFIGNRKEMTR